MRVITLVILLCCLVGVTACASPTPPGYWRPGKAIAETANPQQDNLECLALANQAAEGVGRWSSDPAMQMMQTRDQYFAQCMVSRGYQWVYPK